MGWESIKLSKDSSYELIPNQLYLLYSMRSRHDDLPHSKNIRVQSDSDELYLVHLSSSPISMTKNKGFTILELMISMTLFAIIITSVILAVEHLSIARIKTLNRIALMEELYFFSEQLFMKIKDGGTIDYEEYWDRQSVGTQTES